MSTLEERVTALEERIGLEGTIPLSRLPMAQVADFIEQSADTREGRHVLNERSVTPRELGKFPYAHLKRSNAQTLANAVWTLLDYDLTIADNYQMANTAQTRLYARIKGIYLATGGVQFPTVDTALVGYAFGKNSGGVLTAANIFGGYHSHGAASKDIAPRSAALIRLEPGDYVESYAYQGSGAGVNTAVDANPENYTVFRLMWMGNYDG